MPDALHAEDEPMSPPPQGGEDETLLIRVRDVYKSFDEVPVIQGVSFDVHEGEVLGIIGASGCGKSTLLRLISGLEPVDSGEIDLRNPNYTMVFQYSALFDSLTVYENVAFCLLEPPDNPMPSVDANGNRVPRKQYTDDEIAEIVANKLELLGLEGTENKYPNELSGGMQKRVSFARAIVTNPRIILYDEPTAGLDPIASTVLEDYIVTLRDQLNAASIVVTHQYSTIHRTADRVCLLNSSGKVHWQGTPAELLSCEDPFVRHFAHAGEK
jgi:phospholipid/cholesterol/gamma-HCH transport system ATP-binding protein